VLERLRGRDGDDQRVRVGVPDVLGREDHHPPRDEAGILAGLEHRSEVVDGRVGIAAAHRLDERGGEVVVLVALAVVEQRPLARGVEHVLLRQGGPLRLGCRLCELEDLQRGARIAARTRGEECEQVG
jgi:hypothetical protein